MILPVLLMDSSLRQQDQSLWVFVPVGRVEVRLLPQSLTAVVRESRLQEELGEMDPSVGLSVIWCNEGMICDRPRVSWYPIWYRWNHSLMAKVMMVQV